ncbi:MAG: phage protease [Alkalilacustris sp.]
MTGAAIATASAEPRKLPASTPGAPVPEWVQLLPAPDAGGMIHCRDGRSWLLDDLAGVVADFAAHGAPLAIDYGHSMNRPERAAGWLEQLEVCDGVLWGRIEWTARAREMLAAREFRFFSPTLGVDPKSKRVHKLIGGALVVRPALRMTALASEEVSPATPPATAPGLAARLVGMLGLDPDADADDEAIVAAVAERLRLPAIAAEATATTATTAVGAADPRLDAAAVALAEAVRERAELAAELRRRDAADRVAKAERCGAVNGVTREWALALAESEPRSFDQWLALAAPTFARLLQPSGASAAPPRGRAGVTLAERSDPEGRIAHALGIAPERLAD